MKAKIDSDGWLQVERAGKMEPQACPYYAAQGLAACCGDWCPKFVEHAYSDERPAVTVCGGPTYEIIADERLKGTDNAEIQF